MRVSASPDDVIPACSSLKDYMSIETLVLTAESLADSPKTAEFVQLTSSFSVVI